MSRGPLYPARVTTTLLRLFIAGWIVVLLVRSARTAWSHRRLVAEVWRRVTLRHVLGSALLVTAVLAVAAMLLTGVPWLGHGLGSLVGFHGNAVFVPLEEAVARSGPAPAGGPDWMLIGLATGFLAFLVALLPWLAFVEEEVFRAGLERADLGQQLRSALWFGLVHLVMLVPLAAALAIATAGFAYGRIYRRAFARTQGDDLPPAVAAAFRPTKRAAAAASAARRDAHSGDGSAAGGGTPVDVQVDRRPERRQAAATLASAVWHTTFNTLVIALVWASIVWTAW